MMKKTHTVWVEKYRPATPEDYICEPFLSDKINQWISEQTIPHIALIGPPGSGKTTLTKIITTQIDCDYLYINYGDERSMEVMRDKVKSFASTLSFKKLKIVILDEGTSLLQNSQVILLNMIETFSLNTRFILTGNYPERLIAPFRSRFMEFKLVPPSQKEVAIHISTILDAEEVSYEAHDLAQIVKTYYPDIRKTINEMQRLVIDKKLTLQGQMLTEASFLSKLLDLLKTKNPKKLTEIRQLLADSDIKEYESIYTYLFDNMTDADSIINIAKYQYESSFVVDKEIPLIALFAKLLK